MEVLAITQGGRRLMQQSAQNIRAARKRHGLTQAKFAETLGLSLRQYQRLESGKQWPTRTVWILIDLLETREK